MSTLRYRTGETASVVQFFQTGRTITVLVVDLSNDSLVSLTTGLAVESASAPGIYVWPTTDIVTPPSVYKEYLVVFTDTTSNLVRVSKIILRGYVDDIDTAVSTRASQTSLDALQDVSIADVQTAMTNQGYTAGRASNLDNLDATVISRASQASVDALQDLSIADVQTAMTNQGYTSGRALHLDSLGAATNLPIVHAAGHWDGITFGVTLGLEREGELATNVVSARYDLYTQTGSFLASGTSLSPDAQGVFYMTSSAFSLTNNSAPYMHCRITDVSGVTVNTRQSFPVVG